MAQRCGHAGLPRLFNHNLVSLLYRLRKHHRPGLEYTSPAEGQVANYLFALLGLGTEGLRCRLQVPDRALVFYTGLQAQQPRSMASLEALLADY